MPRFAFLLISLVVAGAMAQTVRAAGSFDLNGTYEGLFIDRGRNLRQANFRLRIRQQGERIDAEATDKTLWITGRIVDHRVELEWEHASGNIGDGSWEILEAGNRLKGSWTSRGVGRFYGEWDLVRQ